MHIKRFFHLTTQAFWLSINKKKQKDKVNKPQNIKQYIYKKMMHKKPLWNITNGQQPVQINLFQRCPASKSFCI